ncbi:MAG TPA: hypothetical protein VMC85_06420 [Desulfomonilaceae bacterium]|nr:hypothetical protein [Desulfomonilaceae bacterium]
MALIGAVLTLVLQDFARPATNGAFPGVAGTDYSLNADDLLNEIESPSLNNTARIDLAQAESPPRTEPVPPRTGIFPVRMSAILKGISNYDAVGPGKTIAGDDKPDGLFVLSVQAQDKEITAIEIRNTDGVASVWDTVPTSTHWAIGVASVQDPVRLLNKKDGSVAIKVQDRIDLNLYVADNGSIEGGKTNYRIAVTFSDGGVSWAPVQRAAQPSSERAPEQVATPNKVNFLGTFLGFASTDAVGRYAGLKPDNEADAVFGLDIEVSPKNFITGIEIGSIDGTGRKWSTTGTPESWGLAVAYQTAPTAILNRTDASVRIPIDGRAQFYLYVADPGDITSTHHRMRIIVHLADGSSYQQVVRRPPATTATVVPGVEEPPRAKGVLICEFRGFIADLVNTSNRPGKDGYLDGTFTLKIEVDNKKLAKVDISGNDGVVRWSSEGKPGTMFLGVAFYPQIYKLINEKGGLMQVPLSGRRTIYLYAADNGMLSDPKATLLVTVTFSDKSSLNAEITK